MAFSNFWYLKQISSLLNKKNKFLLTTDFQENITFGKIMFLTLENRGAPVKTNHHVLRKEVSQHSVGRTIMINLPAELG